jgi:hypothetical protein
MDNKKIYISPSNVENGYRYLSIVIVFDSPPNNLVYYKTITKGPYNDAIDFIPASDEDLSNYAEAEIVNKGAYLPTLPTTSSPIISADVAKNCLAQKHDTFGGTDRRHRLVYKLETDNHEEIVPKLRMGDVTVRSSNNIGFTSVETTNYMIIVEGARSVNVTDKTASSATLQIRGLTEGSVAKWVLISM